MASTRKIAPEAEIVEAEMKYAKEHAKELTPTETQERPASSATKSNTIPESPAVEAEVSVPQGPSTDVLDGAEGEPARAAAEQALTQAEPLDAKTERIALSRVEVEAPTLLAKQETQAAVQHRTFVEQMIARDLLSGAAASDEDDALDESGRDFGGESVQPRVEQLRYGMSVQHN